MRFLTVHVEVVAVVDRDVDLAGGGIKVVVDVAAVLIAELAVPDVSLCLSGLGVLRVGVLVTGCVLVVDGAAVHVIMEVAGPGSVAVDRTVVGLVAAASAIALLRPAAVIPLLSGIGPDPVGIRADVSRSPGLHTINASIDRCLPGAVIEADRLPAVRALRGALPLGRQGLDFCSAVVDVANEGGHARSIAAIDGVGGRRVAGSLKLEGVGQRPLGRGRLADVLAVDVQRRRVVDADVELAAPRCITVGEVALGAAAESAVGPLEVGRPDPTRAEIDPLGNTPRVSAVDATVRCHRPRAVIVRRAGPVLRGDIVPGTLAAQVGLGRCSTVLPRGEDGSGSKTVDTMDSQDVGPGAAGGGNRELLHQIPLVLDRTDLVPIEVDLSAIIDADVEHARAAGRAAHRLHLHGRALVRADGRGGRATEEHGVRVRELRGQRGGGRLDLRLRPEDLNRHAARADSRDEQLLLVKRERIREIGAHVLLEAVLALGRGADIGVAHGERALGIVQAATRRRRRRRWDRLASSGGGASARERDEVRKVGAHEVAARCGERQPHLRLGRATSGVERLCGERAERAGGGRSRQTG
jgi:hypothetical protein